MSCCNSFVREFQIDICVFMYRNVKQLCNKSGRQTRGAEEMKLIFQRATSLGGGRIVTTATHCYKYLGLKLLLIAAVSLFIMTRDGAGVQGGGLRVRVCARSLSATGEVAG
jgi:hypothetical protein